MKETINLFKKSRLPIGIVVISVVAIVLYPAFFAFYVYPSFNKILINDKEKDALEIVNQMISEISFPGDKLIMDDELNYSDKFFKTVNIFKKNFEIIKIRVFSSAGTIIFSTDKKEIGTKNINSYFVDIVSKGKKFSKFVKKDTFTLDGEKISTHVVETYIPVMSYDGFAGAFKIYHDITDEKRHFDNLLLHSYVSLFVISFGLLCAVFFSVSQAIKNLRKRLLAEQKMIEQKDELQLANEELSSLYDVTTVINQTLELAKLQKIILKKMTTLSYLTLGPNGGVLLLKRGRLRLSTSIGDKSLILATFENKKIESVFNYPIKHPSEISSFVIDIQKEKSSYQDGHKTSVFYVIIPVIFVNEPIGIICLERGHDSFINENRLKLLQTIGNQVGIAIKNAKHHERTKELTLKDPLTNLENRRVLDINLSKSIAVSERYNRDLSLIMIDIDYFKKYNDTYGHTAGDSLLVCIADLLRKVIRKSGNIIRYGGEEFLVLLPETNTQEALKVAERIRKTVQSETTSTISLGIASFKQGISDKEFIDRADKALYQAKNNGRNNVVSFSDLP